MHAALAAALYRERPQQLSRAEQEWDVSQVCPLPIVLGGSAQGMGSTPGIG